MILANETKQRVFEHIVGNEGCQQETLDLHAEYLKTMALVALYRPVVFAAEMLRNSLRDREIGLHTNLEYSLDEKLSALGRHMKDYWK